MALLQGRTAVITGTARAAGIGQACAKLLYQNGYNVVGIDYAQHEFAADAPWGTAAAPEAAAAGQQRCAWLQLDLSKPEQVLSVREQIQQLGFNAVTVLVNNAGIADPYMQSDSLAECAGLWQKYISTNLTAPFLLSEALLPIIEEGEGSIIHVSSTRALQSEPHSEVSGQPSCSQEHAFEPT
jgi:NAD(P)-dependent dehydrogenase (short-subunit alcohol dehydrogenase family)